MTTSAMGPLPAVAGCTCRICLPNPPDTVCDETDRSCIDTVHRHGWQVIAVGAGCTCAGCGAPSEPDDGPVFAYTVGLKHRAGHAELAMSGQHPALMMQVLNRVAARIVHDGLRLSPGDLLETALPNAVVLVEEVSDKGLREIATFSRWFHRSHVPAFQLVWPTVTGVFAWQPGAPPELAERQPASWRVRTRRVGAVAVDPPWPLPIAPEEIIVVCEHVREDNEPIRLVMRSLDTEGGELWVAHCGRRGHDPDDLFGEHTAHTVRAAPSLRQLADLGVNQYAERDDAFSPWRRGRILVRADGDVLFL